MMKPDTRFSTRIVLVVLGLMQLGGIQPSANAQEVKKIALLIGVEEYDKAGLEPAVYAEADMTELKTVLEKNGFEVTLMLGSFKNGNRLRATKAKIESAFKAFSGRLKKLNRNDISLVALAGHGRQVRVREGDELVEKPLFCPVDTLSSDTGTMIGLDEWITVIARDSGCSNNLMLVDACRNNPSRGRGGIDGNVVKELPAKMAVFFSASNGTRAFPADDLKHGIFSYYVLEGLKGAASDRENEVTWQNLISYVKKNVPKKSKQVYGSPQNPHAVENLVGLPPVLAKVTVAKPKKAPGLFKATRGASESRARSAQRDWAEYLGTEVVTTNKIGMKMVLIPPGEFMMGSPDDEKNPGDDEGPRHRVQISRPFLLGQYEVTQAQFEELMGFNPSYFSPDGSGSDKVDAFNTSRFPVESVSWYDAVEYCNRLSKKEGREPYYRLRNVKKDGKSIVEAEVAILGGNGYRLPTEAEWEYACRAGTTTPFSWGRTANGREGNMRGDFPYGTETTGPYLGRTMKVGSYSANYWDLYDMHGNVWEWCQDWDDKDYYADSPSVDPEGPGSGSFRVERGGSWHVSPGFCRSAYRFRTTPGFRYDNLGFRVAIVPADR